MMRLMYNFVVHVIVVHVIVVDVVVVVVVCCRDLHVEWYMIMRVRCCFVNCSWSTCM